MTALIKYDAKEIRNQAAMLKEYARQAGNHDAERKLAAIRVRAERKAGELSAALEKRPGKRTDQPVHDDITGSPTKKEALHAAGISQQQAHQWEQLADIPQEHFEAALNGAEMPSTTGILAAAAPPEPAPIPKPAMRVWDWTRVFEKEGYLGRDPNTLLSTMTPNMLDDMHRLAPRIAAWFKKIGQIDAAKN
jgi:hypothetical protein